MFGSFMPPMLSAYHAAQRERTRVDPLQEACCLDPTLTGVESMVQAHSGMGGCLERRHAHGKASPGPENSPPEVKCAPKQQASSTKLGCCCHAWEGQEEAK